MIGHRPAGSRVDRAGLPSIDEIFSASKSLRAIATGAGYEF